LRTFPSDLVEGGQQPARRSPTTWIKTFCNFAHIAQTIPRSTRDGWGGT